MQVAMLGTLEVCADPGDVIEVGGSRLRALLIMLALRSGQVVPAVTGEALWTVGPLTLPPDPAVTFDHTERGGVPAPAIDDYASVRLLTRRARPRVPVAFQGSRIIVDIYPSIPAGYGPRSRPRTGEWHR